MSIDSGKRYVEVARLLEQVEEKLTLAGLMSSSTLDEVTAMLYDNMLRTGLSNLHTVNFYHDALKARASKGLPGNTTY